MHNKGARNSTAAKPSLAEVSPKQGWDLAPRLGRKEQVEVPHIPDNPWLMLAARASQREDFIIPRPLISPSFDIQERMDPSFSTRGSGCKMWVPEGAAINKLSEPAPLCSAESMVQTIPTALFCSQSSHASLPSLSPAPQHARSAPAFPATRIFLLIAGC